MLANPFESLNGDMTTRVVVDTRKMTWTPSPAGIVLRKRLHLVGEVDSGQVTSLVRYLPGAAPGPRELPGGAELFILEGAIEDADGRYPTGTWLRLPARSMLEAISKVGCVAYVKTGTLPSLRSA